MFDNLRESVKDFSQKAKETVAEKEITEDMVDDVLWDLEQALLQNNVAYDVIEAIKDDMREELVGQQVTRTKASDTIEQALKDAVRDVLDQPQIDVDQLIREHDPALFVFMGFNGSGKTTTIARLAHRWNDDHEIVLAAGDTFRSASIEQLEEHADNLNLKLITHEYGADPAAVIYDAVEHAENEDKDLVLADTAGRSHSDKNLMDELAKLCDVNDPDCKFLVVDALAGNDVLEQAEQYEEIGFDGIILTKMDVDKNGGAALSLGYVTGTPICYIGTGQGYEDLKAFDPDAMVEQLLG